MVRIQQPLCDAIDDWRASQRPIPSRIEAIRLLVEQALGFKRGK